MTVHNAFFERDSIYEDFKMKSSYEKRGAVARYEGWTR